MSCKTPAVSVKTVGNYCMTCGSGLTFCLSYFWGSLAFSIDHNTYLFPRKCKTYIKNTKYLLRLCVEAEDIAGSDLGNMKIQICYSRYHRNWESTVLWEYFKL